VGEQTEHRGVALIVDVPTIDRRQTVGGLVAGGCLEVPADGRRQQPGPGRAPGEPAGGTQHGTQDRPLLDEASSWWHLE
jgi:hypothetical protein